MDWHTQLIALYLAVCKHWQAVGWAQAQRHGPCADLDFTDEEVVTIYLFAVAMEQKRQIKDIHRQPGRVSTVLCKCLSIHSNGNRPSNRMANRFSARFQSF